MDVRGGQGMKWYLCFLFPAAFAQPQGYTGVLICRIPRLWRHASVVHVGKLRRQWQQSRSPRLPRGGRTPSPSLWLLINLSNSWCQWRLATDVLPFLFLPFLSNSLFPWEHPFSCLCPSWIPLHQRQLAGPIWLISLCGEDSGFEGLPLGLCISTTIPRHL